MTASRSTTVRIEPAGMSFAADAGTTLLQSAEAAGIELPSGCRNGTCRVCLCRLIDGAILYRIDWPGVSADERDAGWILPCVAEAVGDVTLDVPHAVVVF